VEGFLHALVDPINIDLDVAHVVLDALFRQLARLVQAVSEHGVHVVEEGFEVDEVSLN